MGEEKGRPDRQMPICSRLGAHRGVCVSLGLDRSHGERCGEESSQESALEEARLRVFHIQSHESYELQVRVSMIAVVQSRMV